jgi:hypothetical protein
VLKVLKFFQNLLIVACIAITPCLFLDLLLISSIDFFCSKFVHVFGFLPLVVDHIIGVVVASGCDQPITYTSVSKSTNTHLVPPLLVHLVLLVQGQLVLQFLMCLSLQLFLKRQRKKEN